MKNKLLVKEVRPEKGLSGTPVYKNIAPNVKLVMMQNPEGEYVAQRWVFQTSRDIKSMESIERWFKANLQKDPVSYAFSVEKELADFDGQKEHRKTASTLSKEGGGLESPTTPSDEQMEKILPFLRSSKEPDQLAVFPVLACNTLVDRDDEQFTDRAIGEALKLPDHLSFVGKSFLWDHDHSSKAAIGRIFNVEPYEFQELDPVSGKTDQQGVKEWVYVPKTDANKEYLENLDYGILWAVSVGVRVGDFRCSIDGSPMQMDFCYGAECDAGHKKGYWYSPNDEEAESPSSKALEKDWQYTWIKYNEVQEGMETSQVWLGAQYGAQVPVLQKTVKSLGENPHGNYTGMGIADWAILREVIKVSAPHLHEDKKDQKEPKAPASGHTDPMPSQPAPRPRLELKVDKDADPDQSPNDWRKYKKDGDPDPVEVVPSQDNPEEDKDEPRDTDTEPEDERKSAVKLEFGEGGEMDLRLFYEKLRDSGFPELEDANESAFDNAQGLAEALGKTYGYHQDVWMAEDASLRERAALGDEWLENTRAEIRRVYRLAKASDPTNEKTIRLVDMSRVDDLIKNIGPNALALRGLLEDWTQAAEHRLPKSVRRSSLPETDFLDGRGAADISDRRPDPAVKNIHG